MSGENPCNICEHLEHCEGCIFEHMAWRSHGTCSNYDCMVNHSDCGCLLSLDSYCKASTVFSQNVYVMETDEEELDDETTGD